MRRDGRRASWLASGDLTVARNVADWEKRSLADIASGRLKSRHADGTRRQEGHALQGAPRRRQFQARRRAQGPRAGTAYVLNATMSALAGLKADDVYPAKDVAPPEKTYKAEYAAFDGLVVTAIAWQEDGNNFGQFKAALDPAAARRAAVEPPMLPQRLPAKDRQDKLAALNKEVDALNQAFSGWTFVLSVVRFSNFRKSLDDAAAATPGKNAGRRAMRTRRPRSAPPKPAAK